jgi:hypothetical protein
MQPRCGSWPPCCMTCEAGGVQGKVQVQVPGVTGTECICAALRPLLHIASRGQSRTPPSQSPFCCTMCCAIAYTHDPNTHLAG